MRKHKKKKTASGGRRSLVIEPSVKITVRDGCSNDVVCEDIKIAIRNAAGRCFQNGIF